jgi:glutathione S-transferase
MVFHMDNYCQGIPMSLTLYLHPLASFCHKVLIALSENETEFREVIVDFADPGSAAMLMEQWPVGKIPVLRDEHRRMTLPETSIIIEYLQQHYPGRAALLPGDPEVLLQVRLWDRFYDQYVSAPVQKIVVDRIRPEGMNDPHGVAEARKTLETAYQMIDGQLSANSWAVGESFTLADCAAAPALFYASIVQPIDPAQGNLRAYLDRLLERPSVRRAIAGAQPYFSMFPYREAMPERYLSIRD